MPGIRETRRLPYTAEQMYDLVANVADYPKFLPWTAGARIRSTTEHDDHTIMLADLVISFKVFRETFGSRVVLRPEVAKLRLDHHEKKRTVRSRARARGCERVGGC